MTEYTPAITRYLISPPTGRIENTYEFISERSAEQAAGSGLAIVILSRGPVNFWSVGSFMHAP